MDSRIFPGHGGTIGRRGIEDRPKEPMVSTKGVSGASSHKAEDHPRTRDRRILPLWVPDEGEGWMLVFPNGLALHYGPEPRKREREG